MGSLGFLASYLFVVLKSNGNFLVDSHALLSRKIEDSKNKGEKLTERPFVGRFFFYIWLNEKVFECRYRFRYQ